MSNSRSTAEAGRRYERGIPRLAWMGFLSAALAGGAFGRTAPAPTAPPPDLTPILGASAGDWTFTDKAGRPAQGSIRQTDGLPVLASEIPALLLTGPAEYKPGTEICFTLRLDSKSSAAVLRITGGLSGYTGPVKPLEGFTLSLSAAVGQDDVRTELRHATQGPRESLARRDYRTRWISQRSLGLPEDIRRCVEHQMASLPRLPQKWLRVRWQLREDGTRIYVDDRLLWEAASNTTGRFRLELSKSAEIASLRAEPLPIVPSTFEPVALDGYVNAAVLDRAKLRHDKFPAAHIVTEVGGIPFTLPRPDARGNDHVDLEPSWLQSGFFGGRDSPREGTFGGRWQGAWAINPARLQFTVPAGRYSAIHLLAAADEDPDSVPVVTAQFFHPGAGRPSQVRRADIQRFTTPAGATPHLAAQLDNGKAGNLFLVTIPVDPGALAAFDDSLEIELTKDVRLYRAYPDPMYYSFHQAGQPSSVHVYAMTLQRSPVRLDLEAGNGLHVWVAPEKPHYTAALRAEGPARRVTIETTTTSYDGTERTSREQSVTVRPDREENVSFTFDLKRYGIHELALTVRAGDTVLQTEKRTFAWLHPDTRERGNWDRGKGPLFGFWNWRGGHNTPPGPIPIRIMALAGAETDQGSLDQKSPPEVLAVARQYGIKGYKAFGAGDHYITTAFATDLEQLGLEKARSNLVAKLRDRHIKPDDCNRPLFISFFPEPGIGLHSHGVPLSCDGFSETNDYVFTEAEEKRFQFFLNGFVQGARIVKQQYPGVKCLMPHGDPGFPIPFLRRSKDVRELLDGVTVDIPVFEKMPEYPLHQVSLHRLWFCLEDFRKAGIPNPWLPMYEGPCLPTRPGSLAPEEHAALTVRDALILLAYGVDIQTGGTSPFDAGSYWGEQHYGGGLCDPLPLSTPKPAYAAFATLTRHLNRRNFEKWVPTGSLSVYALQFKHDKDGGLVHVFWTVRGRRPVSVAIPAGSAVSLYDSMDNRTVLTATTGTVSFTVGPAPCFVTGLPDAPAVRLGEPDHSDAAPAPGAVALSRLGDGSWSISPERDTDYEDSFRAFIRRYPSPMTARAVDAPDGKGGPALAVRLEKPARECRTMPFYTTLKPKRPIGISGKASHLGLWVRAASDWGRVVYALRDTKGERWLSIGTSGAYNCDDIHAWSYFNFDGWRYLRFELPACSPYDRFREAGTTWWGAYGKGDRVPDLPLTLEKITVERRTHAMYVNDPQPASTNDVLLGALYAEYEHPEDQTGEAVRLSRLRMPIPAGVADIDNPIREMQETGTGPAVTIDAIDVPLQDSDGTRCTVRFSTTDAAVSYEIWASPYPDGRGAIRVADQVIKSGAQVRGFRPDTDFYLFIAYVDADKKLSKPSKPFKINLKDTFAMK